MDKYEFRLVNLTRGDMQVFLINADNIPDAYEKLRKRLGHDKLRGTEHPPVAEVFNHALHQKF